LETTIAVIEQGQDWIFHYNTGLKIKKNETVECKIVRRTEPWTIVVKPDALINRAGIVTLSLLAKETKKIPFIPENTKWDCYLYDVYLISSNGTKNRIMQGTACLVPEARMKDSERRFT
jgi:hypothetical protein